MKAGRELDALVAKMMGCHDDRQFSTDVAAAWDVVEYIKNKLFTSRYRFVKALQEEMRLLEHEDLTISPSWWIFYLTPEKICLAALKAVQL